MKPWFWLAGAAMLLFAWFALRGPAESPQPQALLKTTAIPVAAPPVARIDEPRPQGVRVDGVLFRGDDAGSQALLSVKDSIAQPYRVGDAVTGGWSLAAIGPDHVVLSLGTVRARLNLNEPLQAARDVAPAAAVPVKTAAVANSEALPGFMPGATGRPPTPTAANLEANRQFKEAIAKRRAGATRQ